MTYNDHLKELLSERERLFRCIAPLAREHKTEDVTTAITDYFILNNFCRNLSIFIDKGVLNGDMEMRCKNGDRGVAL